ncbi:MAG: hypothetical protein QOI33_3405 [Mycobacterium sp.]|nr:hypothetical protein [Mycobacterium sp.]
MKFEDDPEARIRELEQPLAEAARASEAAANQSPSKWAPPSGPPMPPPPGLPPPPGPLTPTPPPLPYTDSFSSPRTGMLPRGQIRWIMLAVFVIGMICLPLVIFHFGAQQVSRSGLPSVLPLPSFPEESPTPSGTMPHTSAGAPTTTSAGKSLSVAGINETRTVVCKDRQVSVSGVGNQVVLTGHCASLSISGVRNKVIVDATESIEASGFDNDITYLIGTPHIDNSGTGNVVHKG